MGVTLGAVVHRHRLSVGDFLRMGEAGILDEDARVELIEGDLIDMAPIGSRHAAIVGRLTHLFVQGVGDRAIVWVQNPISLEEHTMPQPDIALLKPRADGYSPAHPKADDILLIIEVADTMLAYDSTVKLPLYARAGIPEAWLIDLEQGQITRFTGPQQDAYAKSEQLALANVELLALPGVTVDLVSLRVE